ncbi:CocE/NonD family hydrolase C-terminal non-catalytic domain-containing protein [Streptomyces sp. NPDC059991]|uniref:CocE/NonD family hydrolase C-terminal non-catalytic domain-containing protein n=1 Tax=unclassified Streptomyces TaxID=2593676 RepID=UPI0036AE5813
MRLPAVAARWKSSPEHTSGPRAAAWRPGSSRSRTFPAKLPECLAYPASARHSTLITHLFEVSPDGAAHIVTHAPFTHLGEEPGQRVRAEVPLRATGYDVPAGHRLPLVADARDPFYGDADQPRATIDIAADDEDPSYPDLPIG